MRWTSLPTQRLVPSATCRQRFWTRRWTKVTFSRTSWRTCTALGSFFGRSLGAASQEVWMTTYACRILLCRELTSSILPSILTQMHHTVQLFDVRYIFVCVFVCKPFPQGSLKSTSCPITSWFQQTLRMKIWKRWSAPRDYGRPFLTDGPATRYVASTHARAHTHMLTLSANHILYLCSVWDRWGSWWQNAGPTTPAPASRPSEWKRRWPRCQNHRTSSCEGRRRGH